MSETMTPEQEARIKTIGWYRDSIRAAGELVAANAAYEKVTQIIGAATPQTPLEEARKNLDLSNARDSVQNASAKLTSVKAKYAEAGEVCPLPQAAESQIEVHVLREAQAAEDELRSKLERTADPLAKAPVEEILDKVATKDKTLEGQQPGVSLNNTLAGLLREGPKAPGEREIQGGGMGNPG